MDTRRIGSLEVSVVGLGCNNFGGRLDADATAGVVKGALDAGVTFFDTADIYGGTLSETYVGRALAGVRDEVVIATKFAIPYEGHPGGGGAEAVAAAAEASLRRLGTDHIDLYQMHFPDQKTPIAETLGALDELVKAGKVREIGCSNFSVDQLKEAAAAASGAKFVSVQNQYNLFKRDTEATVLPECEAEGLAFLPYSPLADGLLTGKYRAGQGAPAGSRIAGMPDDRRESVLTDDALRAVAQLEALAEAEGHGTVELAVAWLLSRAPVASVIAGATSAAQVQANAAGAGWKLSDATLARIDAIAPPPA